MSVVTIRLSRGALVMGPPGLLPPALIRASDTLTLRTVITNLPRDRTAMAQLRAGWRQFDPSTPVYLLTDAGLMTQMTRLLRGGRLLILYLPYQAGSFSRAELSGPPPGRDWSRADKADKVAEALRRSKDHVGPALYHMVEELVSPTNIAIMVGFIVAVAIAHATGVAGAAIDVVLIGLAWAMAGYAGVKAIVDFIGAIIDVMDARTDAQIDEAARKFAEAFVALGAAFLARMLAKAKTSGSGSTGTKPRPRKEPQKSRTQDPKPRRSPQTQARLDKMPAAYRREYEAAEAAGWKYPPGHPKAGQVWYPPNNGGVGNPLQTHLPKDFQLDRFGGEGGSYLSKAGDTFESRALPGIPEGSPNIYSVTSKGAKRLAVEQSEIAPWFGQPGGGMQYRLVDAANSANKISVADAIQSGLLRRGP